MPVDDGGLTCTACHTGDTGSGQVSLDVTDYVPGQSQRLHVTISDPNATRWGFQLAARPVNNLAQEAGSFTPDDPNLVRVRCDDGTPGGSAGPCSAELREFAEHVSAPSGASPYTFVVNWTAPSQDVGAIALYVAAVAANGDGTVNGDHTYTLVKQVSLSQNAACNNTKAPTLQRIVDAAAFSNNLAGGGLWTIFGLNFETSNLKRGAGPGDFVNGAFPTVLGCIAVTVNGTRVPITYVQTDQINFQAPAVTGPVNVVVLSNAGKPNEFRSATGNATAQSYAPAFFTFNGTSIAAQFGGTANVVANGSVVQGGRPAKPGDIVTLYGTGFGPTNPPVDPGALATGITPTASPVTVMIGNAQADVLYAGLSPQSISGLYQINVRIPTSTPDGDIPVIATVGGAQSQSGATIPIKALQ